MSKKHRLADLQMAIMQVLWEKGETTVAQVRESILRLPDGSWRMWHTIRTKRPFTHKYVAIGSATWAGHAP